MTRDKSLIFNSLSRFSGVIKSLQKPLFPGVFALTLILSAFVPDAQAQCQKVGSTCNLTTIRNTMTASGMTELGCSADSCGIYFLYNQSVTSDSAHNLARTVGAHLASIHSKADNDSVVAWLRGQGLTASAWIGLNDKTQDGKFVWSDGSDTTYKNWAGGAPTGSPGADDCVQIWLSGNDSLTWSDTSCTILLPAVIKVSLCMEVATSGRDTICATDSTSIYASALLGSTPYSYNWAPGGNGDTLKVSPANTTSYMLTVTDAYGCTAVDSAIVKVDTLPVFSMGDSTKVCADSVVILDAGAGYTYLWSSGKTSQKDTLTNPGDYICTRTDGNGCSYSDTFLLKHDTIPFFRFGADTVVCNSDTATIKSPLTHPTYTYLWQDGSTNTFFKTDTADTVILTITNQIGCSHTDTQIVSHALSQNISVGNDTSVCFGDVFKLNGPNNFVFHSWIIYQDTVVGVSINADTAGSYYYFGRDTNNCAAYDTLVVLHDTIPTPFIGNDTNICLGDTLILDAGTGYKQYLWSSGSTTQTTKAYNGVAYNVVVVDSNDCVGSSILILGIDSLPEVTLLHDGLPGDTTICAMDSIWLHAAMTDPNLTYSWNGGPYQPLDDSLKVSNPGKYVLTVQDTNTCKIADSLEVFNDTLPVPGLRTDTTICTQDSIQLVANYAAHYNYVWNSADSGNVNSIWILKDTTYIVKVTDTNTTCFAHDTMVLTHDTLPVINLGPDTGFCIGDTLTLDAGPHYFLYSWTPPAASQSIKVFTPGKYEVEVIDSNGCKGGDSINIAMYQLPTPNLGPDLQFCSGTAIKEPMDPGGGFAYYDWSSGRKGGEGCCRRDTALASGTYDVTVTDNNGCMASDTVVINANFRPNVNLGPDTSFCSGTSFNFLANAGAGFVTYTWFDFKSGAEVQLTNAGQFALVQDTSARLIVEVTDNNGCVNRDSLDVVELPIPSINLGVPERYCETERGIWADTLDADPANNYASYLWSTGETTRDIRVTIEGTYLVTVTANNGCTNRAQKEYNEVARPAIDWSGDTLLCKGDTVHLNAFDEDYKAYYWYKLSDVSGVSDSLLNPIIENPTDTFLDTISTIYHIVRPGTYKVVAYYYPEPFCVDSVQTTIREDIYPEVDFKIQSSDTALCVGEILELHPHFTGSSTLEITYDWQDGNTDSIYYASKSGLYTLVMTNDCGSDIDEVFANFDDCSNIWIPNSFTPNDDGDNDLWKVVSLESFLEFNLKVYDRFGGIAWETNNPDVSWNGRHMINGKDMPIGAYAYKLTYRSNYELIDGVNSAPTRELQGTLYLYR
ncbi:gliding motility-associated C-terminal domain-containing protein [bacterium SCSIO 12741]|nr:gliding motility-associated C-terminal domain-containing protein [bacterium SCSIO 12741]